MTPQELRERATNFAVDVVKFTCELRRRPEARHVADQLNASATAVAANYRSSSRARSRREFISKLAVAVEEADESVGWLEVVTRAGLEATDQSRDLLREARELLAILAASRRTAERNRPNGTGRTR